MRSDAHARYFCRFIPECVPPLRLILFFDAAFCIDPFSLHFHDVTMRCHTLLLYTYRTQYATYMPPYFLRYLMLPCYFTPRCRFAAESMGIACRHGAAASAFISPPQRCACAAAELSYDTRFEVCMMLSMMAFIFTPMICLLVIIFFKMFFDYAAAIRKRYCQR